MARVSNLREVSKRSALVRKARIAIASLAVVASGVAVAPVASAAEVSVTLNCSGPVTVTANPGDTIIFTLSTACGDYGFLGNLNTAFGSWSESGFLTWTGGDLYGPRQYFAADWLTVASSVTPKVVYTTLASVDGAGAPLTAGSVIGVVGGDTRSTASWNPIIFQPAGTPVPMWHQAFGRASATDTCPSTHTPSWHAWPNGGRGGFVCQRFVPMYGN